MALAPLNTPPLRIPLASTTTPDGTYRYTLYPSDVVVVEKMHDNAGESEPRWEHAYTIRSGICPCISGQHRGSCKHADVAAALYRWYRGEHG